MQTTTQRALALNERAARAVGRFFVRLCGLGMSEVQEMEFELALLTGLLEDLRDRQINAKLEEIRHRRENRGIEAALALYGEARPEDELKQVMRDARHEYDRLLVRYQELRRQVGAIRSMKREFLVRDERRKVIEELRRATARAAMWSDALHALRTERDPPKPTANA